METSPGSMQPGCAQPSGWDRTAGRQRHIGMGRPGLGLGLGPGPGLGLGPGPGPGPGSWSSDSVGLGPRAEPQFTPHMMDHDQPVLRGA